jgi:hypothetical protein
MHRRLPGTGNQSGVGKQIQKLKVKIKNFEIAAKRQVVFFLHFDF